ncbi:MAG: hypothetical protein VX320_02670 [Candidatus Thermoplasmatota archaeon]|nr:hypothetical protein [Candidatus Thermoplasmatota archaeon]
MADADDSRRTQRRINTLLRDRDAIRRMLEQADYQRVARDIGRQSVSIERIEKQLAGHDA